METKEGVKETGTPEPVKVDEKGVPLENRVKEYERKLEASTKQLEDTNREIAELREFRAKMEAERKPVVDQQAIKKQKLEEFVGDPEAFIEQRVQERYFRDKQHQAEEWIRAQPGYDSKKDDQEIISTIFGISNPDPTIRAKAAWEAKENKRLAEEFRAFKAEKARENGLSQSMPDGAGRTQDVSQKPKRADLLVALKAAEVKGDNKRLYEVMSQLSDARD